MSPAGTLASQAALDAAHAPTAPRAAWRRQRTLVLVVALGVLNLADLVTTRLVLDRGGSEGNPIMRPLVEGVWGAAALKIGCVGLIAVLARRCLMSVRVQRGLVAVVAWYGFVVAWNLTVYARS